MNEKWVAAAALMLVTGSARGDFGDPLPGSSAVELQLFSKGRTAFDTTENVAAGLGPVFNESACSTCHVGPNGAVGGNTTRVETRFGAVDASGIFDPLAELGGSLLQDRAIGSGDGSVPLPPPPLCDANFSFVPESVPNSANVVAKRRTTPLFGLGLVDATPDPTFLQLAASQRASTPSTAGVVSLVTNPDTKENNVVGRFGWKAQNATLHVFAGDAYLNEMGITNPSFPKESCPNGDCAQLSCNPVPALNDDGGDVDAFANFMRLLAPPPRGPLAPNDKEGENVFARIGCANCHTPTLTTGANGSAALNHKDYHPYSDFLLHDMGALGDGITQNGATGQLMRTAPLWGLRTQVKLLHDARTTSVIDAIHAHDGQGAASRAAFDALNAEQRRKLLAFLASL